MAQIIPTNQISLLNNADVRIFDFNNISSRYYLGDVISKGLFSSYGDGIIEGLEINGEFIGVDMIRFSIKKGKFILDNVNVIYSDDFDIEFNCSGYDDLNGKIIVNIDYKYFPVMTENKSKVETLYITNEGIPNGEWYVERKHLILGVFEFNKSEQSLTQIVSPIVYPKFIDIKNESYEIRKIPALHRRGINLLHFATIK